MIAYPTADELRSAGKGLHGIPADRLRASYAVAASGCWPWLKGRTSGGYGHFSVRRVYYQAHLLVYILFVGPLPDASLQPDHLCRNRGCVNPAHLEFVTPAVNCQRGNAAVLTSQQVATIRAARSRGIGVRALARRYGVNHATISRIANGLIWREAVA